MNKNNMKTGSFSGGLILLLLIASVLLNVMTLSGCVSMDNNGVHWGVRKEQGVSAVKPIYDVKDMREIAQELGLKIDVGAGYFDVKMQILSSLDSARVYPPAKVLSDDEYKETTAGVSFNNDALDSYQKLATEVKGKKVFAFPQEAE